MKIVSSRSSRSRAMDDILKSIGVGRRSPHDEFFNETYNTCKIFDRKGVTIIDDEELCHEAVKEFSCNVPGCNSRFQTLFDFEMHYNGCHRYICLECRKSKPSPRLLDIHVQEAHDSFFKVMAEKQPMYQCYVQECEIRFTTAVERREHCVKVHKYPKHFRFDEEIRRKYQVGAANQMELDKDVRSSKSDRTLSGLNKNQKFRTFGSSIKRQSSKSLSETTPSNVSENFTPVDRSSSLMFVPRQVMSYSKLLTNNKNSEKDVLNGGCMMELAESLPD